MVASGQPYGYSGDIPCLLCSRLQRYTNEHTNPNVGLRTPDTVPPVELPMPEELTFEPNKCYTDWQEGTASKINELIRNIRYIREGR
jgi:hypothetical protein